MNSIITQRRKIARRIAKLSRITYKVLRSITSINNSTMKHTCDRIKNRHTNSCWTVGCNYRIFSYIIKGKSIVETFIKSITNLTNIYFNSLNLKILTNFMRNINIMLLTLWHINTDNLIFTKSFNTKLRCDSAVLAATQSNNRFTIRTILYEIILNPVFNVINFNINIFSNRINTSTHITFPPIYKCKYFC